MKSSLWLSFRSIARTCTLNWIFLKLDGAGGNVHVLVANAVTHEEIIIQGGTYHTGGDKFFSK